MSRNRVKYANVTLSKLTYNLLDKEIMHFGDVKVEKSSSRLVNVFLVSYQSFKGVSELTRPSSDVHGRVRDAKNI